MKMGDFKVIEIVDARTIKVIPDWIISDGEQEIIGNKVKILDLNVEEANQRAFERLKSLLMNKEVDLINPELLDYEFKIVSCNVILEKTNITYYFPEYEHEMAM